MAAFDQDHFERLVCAGDLTGAEAYINVALTREPNHTWYYSQLSMLSAMRGLYQAALDYAEQAVVINGEDPLAQWCLADALIGLKRPGPAEGILSALIDESPEELGERRCSEGAMWAADMQNDARYLMAKVHALRRDYRTAEQWCTAHISGRSATRSVFAQEDVMDYLAALRSYAG